MSEFTINDPDVSVEGTCLQGHLHASYAGLVDCFGEPKVNPYNQFGNYKVDALWVLAFDGDVVATVYNYKDGKNYLDDEGTAVENITSWHIGGHSEDAVALVMRALAEAQAEERHTGETPVTDVGDGEELPHANGPEYLPGQLVRLASRHKLHCDQIEGGWTPNEVTYESTVEAPGHPPVAVVRGMTTVRFTTEVPLRDLRPLNEEGNHDQA